MINEFQERLEEPARSDLSTESTAIRRWLENRRPHGKRLALFSCAPRDLWQAHSFSIRVENHLAFEPRPDVAPLPDLLDEYER